MQELITSPPVRTGVGDEEIAQCPNKPAVFLIHPSEGKPYLSRTSQLRRRLLRLLGPRAHPSRMLHLREVAAAVEYWPYRAHLESSLILYTLARRYFPDTYAEVLKLRQPAYVRLALSNAYPRTMVTGRLSGSDSVHFGPFRTRAAAELFEAGVLDFFQIRHCQEDLLPAPDHPGCLYGEMNKCLRPCQLIVSDSEYRGEARRVAAFFNTRGQSLIETTIHARDRFSAELEFEEAARMHKRLERIESVMQSAGDLSADVARLSGVAVLPPAEPEAVVLCFFHEGSWLPPQLLSLRVEEGKPAPLDRRIREVAAGLQPPARVPMKDRQDHLALLAAWFYSSWRTGEWVPSPGLAALPVRKLVNAIHRVARKYSANS